MHAELCNTQRSVASFQEAAFPSFLDEYTDYLQGLTSTWRCAFDDGRAKALTLCYFIGAIASTYAALEGAFVFVFVSLWGATVWGMLWYVWFLIMAFCPGSEHLIEHWDLAKGDEATSGIDKML